MNGISRFVKKKQRFCRRRRSFGYLLAAQLLMISSTSVAQSSGNPGLFGIDGDLYSDTVLHGSFAPQGSHDWFFKAGGTGLAIFDTISSSQVSTQISNGLNYNFTKKMQYPRYSMQAGMMLYDATYYRDDVASSLPDHTTFTSGSNSAQNPTTWSTVPKGTSVQDKTDIVDAFVHMRRLSNSSNHLVAYVAGSSLGTTGNRYFDFEFYRSRISYDTTTGQFSNSGPSASGGHTPFVFNPDGTIGTFGDMTVSFAFSSTAMNSIDLYLWTDYQTFSTTTPSGFDFDHSNAGWFGLSNSSGYGYAHILPKSGSSLSFWGMVNTSNTPAPPWGSNSKDIGVGKGFFTPTYFTGQFAEAAVDLTSLGIDPLAEGSASACSPPYTRVLVKSRSSSSFSSALADFVSPIEFLDAPLVSASIAPASNLTCSSSTEILRPAAVSSNAGYEWSTNSGSFASRTDTTSPVISKPGRYYLKASLRGCNNFTYDSVLVLQDSSRPVATASYTGTLTNQKGSNVTLQGGDTTASNVMTAFGASLGLSWYWTGPDGFSSTLENPTTGTPGFYQLTVTEKRNGCTATTSTLVAPPGTPLATMLIDFDGNYDAPTQQINLRWSAADAQAVYFDVQMSSNGWDFSTVAVVPSRALQTAYHFSEKREMALPVFYRIAVKTQNQTYFSSVVRVDLTASEAKPAAYLNQQGRLVVDHLPSFLQKVNVLLVTGSGQKVFAQSRDFASGSLPLTLPVNRSLSHGLYYLLLIGQGYQYCLKVML